MLHNLTAIYAINQIEQGNGMMHMRVTCAGKYLETIIIAVLSLSKTTWRVIYKV